MQEERPDIAELLTQPIWYFDRKGEVSDGQEDYIRCAIYYIEKGNGRVYSKYVSSPSHCSLEAMMLTFSIVDLIQTTLGL